MCENCENCEFFKISRFQKTTKSLIFQGFSHARPLPLGFLGSGFSNCENCEFYVEKK